jgi:uncharacterized RDD family membrane protein YckC
MRLLARALDGLIFFPLAAWLLSQFSICAQIPNTAFAMLILLLSIVAEGFFLNQFRATPGKMLLGIQICQHNGQNLSFWQGSGRAANAWVMGTGLCLSGAISLALLWTSYNLLRRYGAAPWDLPNHYLVNCIQISAARKWLAGSMLPSISSFFFYLL